MTRAIVISGFAGCKYFGYAQDLARQVAAPLGHYMVNSFGTRETYHAYREEILKQLNMAPDAHKTSPMCFFVEVDGNTVKPVEFLGGFDKFKAYVEEHIDMNNLVQAAH